MLMRWWLLVGISLYVRLHRSLSGGLFCRFVITVSFKGC